MKSTMFSHHTEFWHCWDASENPGVNFDIDLNDATNSFCYTLGFNSLNTLGWNGSEPLWLLFWRKRKWNSLLRPAASPSPCPPSGERCPPHSEPGPPWCWLRGAGSWSHWGAPPANGLLEAPASTEEERLGLRCSGETRVSVREKRRSSSCLDKDVESGSSTLAGLQRSEQSCLVDDAAAGAVHHLHSLLALCKGLVVKQTWGRQREYRKLNCTWGGIPFTQIHYK